MFLKYRIYFTGITLTTVFLIFFWSYTLPYSSHHPRISASSYLMPKRSSNADNKPALIDNGWAEAQKTYHQNGPETEHMEIRNGAENKDKEENDRENKGDDSSIVFGLDSPKYYTTDDLYEDDGEDDPDMGDEEEDANIDDTEEEKELLEENSEELGVKGESPAIVESTEKKLLSKSMEKYEQTREETNGKRYLIYLCDKRVKCSGFADRQRAIVGVYLMALATNRTFGLIMKVPASIQDFYVPNKVNWDISPEDLEGKSTIDLDCFSKHNECNFKDLNAFYPQDVIYLRSRNDFLHILGRLGHYRYHLPDWALGSQIVTFGHAWTTLMKPTQVLRDGVNSLLLEVAKEMHGDVKIIPKIQKTDSCVSACKEITKQENFQNQSIDECFDVLDSLKELDQKDRVIFLRHMCPVETAITPPPLDTIKAATGYDYAELGMVCAQVRLGNGSSLRREPEINKMKDIVKIWNILRPFINKGHHMFLASDSQKVRDQAKEMFGPRAHVYTDPIVHINKVEKDVDGWQGMKTALMEQLFLSTSCKVLVFSYSGYGKKSAMLRHVLTKGNKGFKTYEFYKGRVKYTDFDQKPPKLPTRDD